MRALLDRDVVLDVFLARQLFVVEAAALLLANEQQLFEAFISPITPVNVFYIIRKAKGPAIARQAVDELLKAQRVCSLDHAVLYAAHALPMADFEDAVQAVAAAAAGLDAIITRNTKDFANAPLPILTPAEGLARLASAGHSPAPS
jgi:predicted nucleic acid-binding protein